uniref:Uncharacterized protein n=1 Tax=Lygus hesperus TaxID=30085 RepID=A0A0A9Z9A8_LYGHE
MGVHTYYNNIRIYCNCVYHSQQDVDMTDSITAVIIPETATNDAVNTTNTNTSANDTSTSTTVTNNVKDTALVTRQSPEIQCNKEDGKQGVNTVKDAANEDSIRVALVKKRETDEDDIGMSESDEEYGETGTLKPDVKVSESTSEIKLLVRS